MTTGQEASQEYGIKDHYGTMNSKMNTMLSRGTSIRFEGGADSEVNSIDEYMATIKEDAHEESVVDT